jgi:hypothetical protein
MKAIEKRKEFERANVIAARIILDKPEQFGGAESLMINWAERVIRKHTGLTEAERKCMSENVGSFPLQFSLPVPRLRKRARYESPKPFNLLCLTVGSVD